MSIATAFQSVHKSLALETRFQTLALYRSLIRATQSFEQHYHVMRKEIRAQFKKNQYTTSRPKVLEQLKEAYKTLQVLEDRERKSHIVTYVKTYCVPKWEKKTKKIVVEKKKKPKTKKKHVERKPYQVAMTTKCASGYEFKRVRGWRQPVQTSMMLKNRVKKNQERLDRFNELREQLEMMKEERRFLSHLDCLPEDKLEGFEKTIKLALGINNKYRNNFLSKIKH